MRIIKLGTGEFPTFDKVEDYFYVKLLKEEREEKQLNEYLVATLFPKQIN